MCNGVARADRDAASICGRATRSVPVSSPHTAGNPGRHAFDETQELYYPAICKAIADLGYTGYFAHEYTPTKDALPTLEKMLKICEV